MGLGAEEVALETVDIMIQFLFLWFHSAYLLANVRRGCIT